MSEPLDVARLLELAASGDPLDTAAVEAPIVLPAPTATHLPSFQADGLTFIQLPAGPHFIGGDDSSEPEQRPRRAVELPGSCWLATMPVTQHLWQRVMGEQPSRHAGGLESGLRPAESISWNDAQTFIEALNDRLAQTPDGAPPTPGPPSDGLFRLPSEVEWEVAARAGSTTRWCFGDAVHAGLVDHAWYAQNSGARPQLVGMLQPNDWGLHDMHGLVQEWCADAWHPDHTGTPSDGSPAPPPPDTPADRSVARGGSWLSEAEATTSSARRGLDRGKRSDTVGLRLAWSPPRSDG